MTKIKNKHHSNKVRSIAEMQFGLENKVKKRKSIGLAIHALINARRNTEDPKLIDAYTTSIDDIHKTLYVPLTNLIKDYITRIKELKKETKYVQRFCDKYSKMIGDDGTVKYRNFQTNEVKHGKICGAMITYGDGFIPVTCLDAPKRSFWDRLIHHDTWSECDEYIQLTELLPL